MSIWALFRLYRRLKPEIIHHLTIKPILYGSIAARVARVASVINALTGMGYVFTEQGIKAAILRKAIVTAYRVAFALPRHRMIFQNPDDQDFFIGSNLIKANEAVIIKGSGVNCSQFIPTEERDGLPIVILPARMLWHKGVAEFKEAATTLRKEGSRARFVLAGKIDEGNPACIPEKQIKAFEETGCVEWWGFQGDMSSVLSRCAIVCLPSYYREGVPRVLIEAAAAGRPIVTTDTPGCREIVRDGENGFLVPARDSQALTNALRKLLFNPELRKHMGQKGRKLVEAEFSEEIVIQKTLAVYKDLLSSEKLIDLPSKESNSCEV